MRDPIYKTIRTILLPLLFFSFYYTIAQIATSKVSDFNCIIINAVQPSVNVLEFDLYLLDKNPSEPFELASVQLGILVNPKIYAGGDVTASIIEGSSDLIIPQKPSSIVFTQISNSIKIAGKIIKPLASSDPHSVRGSLISTTYPGTRICRVRLTNTKAFDKYPADLTFNFTKTPYPTTITQYISGTNTPLICDKSNCFSKATNAPLK
jgi:hypothetical protein